MTTNRTDIFFWGLMTHISLCFLFPLARIFQGGGEKNVHLDPDSDLGEFFFTTHLTTHCTLCMVYFLVSKRFPLARSVGSVL